MLVRSPTGPDVANASGRLTGPGRTRCGDPCAILRRMFGLIDSSVTILYITLGIPVVVALIVWGATSLRPRPRG